MDHGRRPPPHPGTRPCASDDRSAGAPHSEVLFKRLICPYLVSLRPEMLASEVLLPSPKRAGRYESHSFPSFGLLTQGRLSFVPGIVQRWKSPWRAGTIGTGQLSLPTSETYPCPSSIPGATEPLRVWHRITERSVGCETRKNGPIQGQQLVTYFVTSPYPPSEAL